LTFQLTECLLVSGVNHWKDVFFFSCRDGRERKIAAVSFPCGTESERDGQKESKSPRRNQEAGSSCSCSCRFTLIPSSSSFFFFLRSCCWLLLYFLAPAFLCLSLPDDICWPVTVSSFDEKKGTALTVLLLANIPPSYIHFIVGRVLESSSSSCSATFGSDVKRVSPSLFFFSPVLEGRGKEEDRNYSISFPSFFFSFFFLLYLDVYER